MDQVIMDVGALMRALLLPLGVMAVDYISVTAAVVADLRSGLKKARRKGEAITSRGYRQTLEKLGCYLSVLAGLTTVDAMLIAAAVCLRLTGGYSLPLLPVLTSLGAIGIVLVEVKSIAENSGRKRSFAGAMRMVRRLAEVFNVKRMLP
ncbi:MAG: phage holin family protein [Muribaculaceae bacterium]|nr:phage holin family protein [Muribaculaceae bacterium]